MVTTVRCSFILIHLMTLTINSETITNPATATITCQGGQDCTIVCTTADICRDALITCPTDYQCTLTCGTNVGACRQATVHAEDSSRFEINDCSTGNKFTCTGMTIYWPPNNNGVPRGFLNVGDNFNGNSASMIFYAVYGWKDINTLGYTGTYTKHTGAMYCTLGYGSSCTFQPSAWTCLASGDLTCNNPPTPPPTTAAPTPVPTTPIPTAFTSNPSVATLNPSIQTSNPTTVSPTLNPTDATSTPTAATSNPSVQTSNPTTAVPTFTSNPSVNTLNPTLLTSNPTTAVPTLHPTVLTANPTDVSTSNNVVSTPINLSTYTTSNPIDVSTDITSNPAQVPSFNPITTTTTTTLMDIATTKDALGVISEDTASGKGGAAGGIIGAIIGTIVFAVGGVYLFLFCKKRRLRKLESLFGAQETDELPTEFGAVTNAGPVSNKAHADVEEAVTVGKEKEAAGDMLEVNPVHLQRTWEDPVNALSAETEHDAFDYDDPPPPPPPSLPQSQAMAQPQSVGSNTNPQQQMMDNVQQQQYAGYNTNPVGPPQNVASDQQNTGSYVQENTNPLQQTMDNAQQQQYAGYNTPPPPGPPQNVGSDPQQQNAGSYVQENMDFNSNPQQQMMVNVQQGMSPPQQQDMQLSAECQIMAPERPFSSTFPTDIDANFVGGSMVNQSPLGGMIGDSSESSDL